MEALELWPNSVSYFVSLSLLALLASIGVGLRFWSRKVTGLGTHIDDWLALLTAVLNHALTASIFVSFILYGLGANYDEIAKNPVIFMRLKKVGQLLGDVRAD